MGTPNGADIDITDPGSRVSAIGGITSANSSFHLPRINDGTDASFLANYNRRMRVPRATDTGALPDPKIGDMVYTPQTGLQVYRGSGIGWRPVVTTASP
jgi:hypothetical protein